MAFRPTQETRRHNAVRFTRTQQEETEPGLTRLEFSRTILQRGMGFSPSDLNCLVKLPGLKEVFEVSFRNPQKLQEMWSFWGENKYLAPYKEFCVDALTDREMKVVTVQFFNEAVSDYDITTWLNRYGRVSSEGRKITDEDGVWTGARKWLVRLNVDPSGIGGVRHIPNSIVLGPNRGLVFYNGMPKLCRKCGELGHLAAACTVVKCRNCGAPHETSHCREERQCNLCGKKGHLFKDCPSSYANMARASKANTNKPRPEQEEGASNKDQSTSPPTASRTQTPAPPSSPAPPSPETCPVLRGPLPPAQRESTTATPLAPLIQNTRQGGSLDPAAAPP